MSSPESCVDHDKEETLKEEVLKPALKTHSANHMGFITIRNRSPFHLYFSGAGNEAGYYLNGPKTAFEKSNRNTRYEECLGPEKVGAFAHLENYSGSFWKNTSLVVSFGGLYGLPASPAESASDAPAVVSNMSQLCEHYEHKKCSRLFFEGCQFHDPYL
eukprot:gene251-168_t